MRLVAAALVVVSMAGCAFVRREQIRQTCTRRPAHIDFAIAGAGVAVAAATGIAVRCEVTVASCDQTGAVYFIVGPALIASVAALASAAYGEDVAGQCDAQRK